MATNALVIEFGAAGKMDEKSLETLQETLALFGSWKSESIIDDYRLYSVVTGNRTQRVALIVLEVSHEQLEALVVNPAYGKLFDVLERVGTNITVNRAITSDRLLELAKDFMRERK